MVHSTDTPYLACDYAVVHPSFATTVLVFVNTVVHCCLPRVTWVLLAGLAFVCRHPKDLRHAVSPSAASPSCSFPRSSLSLRRLVCVGPLHSSSMTSTRPSCFHLEQPPHLLTSSSSPRVLRLKDGSAVVRSGDLSSCNACHCAIGLQAGFVSLQFAESDIWYVPLIVAWYRLLTVHVV